MVTGAFVAGREVVRCQKEIETRKRGWSPQVLIAPEMFSQVVQVRCCPMLSGWRYTLERILSGVFIHT